MSIFAGFLAALALFPIESIQVEGVKRLKPAQVVAATGLRVGQNADKPDFDAAQARLVATGVLGSVGYRYTPSATGKGYVVTFEVVEIDQVFPLKFEELERPDAELKKVLSDADPMFTDPVPATPAVIKKYEVALSAHLKSEVVGRVLADKPGEEVLIFRPNRPRPTVASVTFKGNQAFPLSELQNRMAAVAVGTLFTEERFRELLANQIRPIYETKGLLRVSFPKVTAVRATDVEGFDIEVDVVEGPEYVLDAIAISGFGGGDELVKAAGFKSGDVFRLNEVVDSLEKLRAILRSQGYMKVATEATRLYNDQRKTVDLYVEVKPGPQFKMGRLAITGLDITTEPVIRKMWGLKEGAPYREGYPERLLARIRDDGIFDNLGETKAKLDLDEANALVHVTLQFAGQKKEPEKKRPF